MTPVHLEQLAADVQAKWVAGDTPDALVALAAHPELAAWKPLVLELAFEEYSLRAEAGAPPDAVAFAAPFPFAADIAALLAVHSVLNRKWSSGAARRPKVALHPGDVVGDLRVLRRIARGGFSDVYLGRNAAVGDRPEVLKVSTRGEEEARTLGPLAHPHLMPVLAAPTVNGLRAVVSPFLGLATGETLVGRATGRTPTTGWLLRVAGERQPGDPPVTDRPAFPIAATTPYPTAVLHVAAALAAALRYLHDRGIAHRDLKPSNLLFGPTGFPYLLDLNLADDGRGGRAGGTVAYAPPEVLARLAGDTAGAVNWQAADVFSFAVLVVELLLVRHPYLGCEALTRIDADTVPAAARAARGTVAAERLPLPPAVRTLLLDCLSVNPADRPTADRLARTLTAAVAPQLRLKRRGLAVAVAAVVVAAGGVGVGGWVAQANAKAPTEQGLQADADREPTDPFERGVWLVRNDQPTVAIVHFTEAARTDASGRATEWLSYCHASSDNPAAVLKYGDDAEKAGRKTTAVYANRAAAKMLQADDTGAANDAAKALEYGDSPAARLTRGLAVYKIHSREESVPRKLLAELEEAIPGNEENATLWLNVAEARARVEDRDPADVTEAIKAVQETRRTGGSRLSVETNTAITAALTADPRYQTVLVTPSAHDALGFQAQLVRPE